MEQLPISERISVGEFATMNHLIGTNLPHCIADIHHGSVRMTDVLVVISNLPPINPQGKAEIARLWTSLTSVTSFNPAPPSFRYMDFKAILVHLHDNGRLHQPRMFRHERSAIFNTNHNWLSLMHLPEEQEEYPALKEAYDTYISTLAITTGRIK